MLEIGPEMLEIEPVGVLEIAGNLNFVGLAWWPAFMLEMSGILGIKWRRMLGRERNARTNNNKKKKGRSVR